LKIYFLSFSLLLALMSCNTPPTEKTETKSAPVKTVVAAEKLPSIPVAILQKLFDNCDYVDYLFYETNFSMSMNNKGSIQQTLTHVSQTVPVLDNTCKSIGRVFYEINGETEIEAEIYFSDKCQYFVFMKDNKRIYANNITPDGVAHFQNIFKQASAMGKG